MRHLITEKGCWNWTGPTDAHGYGIFQCDGKRILAHRVAYAMGIGPIMKGRIICHRCDNTSCINPEHLFSGLPLDNNRDMISKGRARYVRGEAASKSKLTADQVRAIRAEWSTAAVSIRSIARKYKVNHGSISQIVHRRSWSHI